MSLPRPRSWAERIQNPPVITHSLPTLSHVPLTLSLENSPRPSCGGRRGRPPPPAAGTQTKSLPFRFPDPPLLRYLLLLGGVHPSLSGFSWSRPLKSREAAVGRPAPGLPFLTREVSGCDRPFSSTGARVRAPRPRRADWGAAETRPRHPVPLSWRLRMTFAE